MSQSKRVFLALDQGTHSSRAILFGDRGQFLEKFQVSIGLNRIDEVTVEQDPVELLDSVRNCLQQAIAAAKDKDWQVVAAGLATQRSSVLAWDRGTGQALSPVLSWQDRRQRADVDLLKDIAPRVRQLTGLPLTPHYGASKMQWLHSVYSPHQPQLIQNGNQTDEGNRVAIGPLASFLVANLVDGVPYCVDHTNALRTQLMNLKTLDWDPWLVETFGLNEVELPQCVPVVYEFGLTNRTIPLTAVSGDQTAALYSQGPLPNETALVNLGTGGFILKQDDSNDESDQDLLGGLSLSDGATTQYLIEGTVNGCGSAIKWAAERLSLGNDFHSKTEDWLKQNQRGNPYLFLNSIGGLGSPFWVSDISPGWFDENGQPIVDPAPGPAIAAVVESIVFLICENFQRMTRGKPDQPVSGIRVSGGLSNLDGVCQRLANMTQCHVTRTSIVEATASGVAWMAAGRPSNWASDQDEIEFLPEDDRELADRFEAFRGLIEKTIEP